MHMKKAAPAVETAFRDRSGPDIRSASRHGRRPRASPRRGEAQGFEVDQPCWRRETADCCAWSAFAITICPCLSVIPLLAMALAWALVWSCALLPVLSAFAVASEPLWAVAAPPAAAAPSVPPPPPIRLLRELDMPGLIGPPLAEPLWSVILNRLPPCCSGTEGAPAAAAGAPPPGDMPVACPCCALLTFGADILAAAACAVSGFAIAAWFCASAALIASRAPLLYSIDMVPPFAPPRRVIVLHFRLPAAFETPRKRSRRHAVGRIPCVGNISPFQPSYRLANAIL